MTLHQEQPSALLIAIEAQIHQNGGINSTLIAIEKEWKHEIKGRSNHQAWSQDEFKSLREQLKNGIMMPIIEGRSPSSVRNVLQKVGRRNLLSQSKEYWSKHEVAYLKRCVTTGITPKMIGRSSEAIFRKLGRLKLSSAGLGLDYRRKVKHAT